MTKQLYYGSLEDHMRASRREMNQSYVNQQNQLMSMNIVREAQRLQLSQADTIVKLNQLKDKIKLENLKEEKMRTFRVSQDQVIPTNNEALADQIQTNIHNYAPSEAPTVATDFSETLSEPTTQLLSLKHTFQDLTREGINAIKNKGLGSELDTVSSFIPSNVITNTAALTKVLDAFKTLIEAYPPSSKSKPFILTPEAQYSYKQLFETSGSGLKQKKKGALKKPRGTMMRNKNGRFTSMR